MKVKLKGKLFTNPMEYNHISIHDSAIDIHNSNNSGYGFIDVHNNPTPVPDGFEFTLNKKDYGLISNLGDFYVEKTGDAIRVISDHFKGKFADLKMNLLKPDLENMNGIVVPFDVLFYGKLFANKPDAAHPQYDGIAILKDRVIASDSYCIYQHDIISNLTPINIPKDIFKYLGKKQYSIKTNRRIVVFELADSMFYSNIIDTLLSTGRLDDNGIVEIIAPCEELLEKVKIIKEYSNECHISIDHEVMTLSTSQETNELSLSLTIKPTNVGKLEFTASASQLIKMIGMVEDEDVSIKFNENMVKICWNGTITASGRIRDRKDYVVEGAVS